jgi:hypothetical protein
MGKRDKRYKQRKKTNKPITRPTSFVHIYFLGYHNKVFTGKFPLEHKGCRKDKINYFKEHYTNYLGSIGEPEYK